MILSKKLTQVLYVGAASLTLASLPASVKGGIKLIRQVNTAGSGYASFNPASGVNSLSSVAAPTAAFIAQLIIETISGTPSVDLGSDFVVAAAAATTSGGAQQPAYYVIDGSAPIAGETVYEAAEQISPDTAGVLTAVFRQGSGTAEISFDSGQTWAPVNNTAVSAGAVYALRVQHGEGVGFIVTLTYTYA